MAKAKPETAPAAEKPKEEAAKPAGLNVTRGKTRPPRIVIYGGNGVGKTSLVADIGKGIMIDCEEGADHAPIDRFAFEDGRDRPLSFDEIFSAIRTIIRTEHDYETLVIDGLDELERLIWAKVCKDTTPQKGEKPDQGIEGFHFARGKKIAVGEWRRLAEALEYLRRVRNMSIVLVGHAETVTVKNPTGDDYDQHSINIHKEARGFLYGWADIVGFMDYETFVSAKPNDDDKAIATATGVRLLHLRDGAAWAAKARSEFAIPDKIEIPREHPWAPVSAALKGK